MASTRHQSRHKDFRVERFFISPRHIKQEVRLFRKQKVQRSTYHICKQVSEATIISYLVFSPPMHHLFYHNSIFIGCCFPIYLIATYSTFQKLMSNDDSMDISGGGDGKFHFAIDRGGTFTDVVCRLPEGREVVFKLLSEDPSHYEDAPTEGIRRLLQEHDSPASGIEYPRGTPVKTDRIGSIRMGTTVATNALLERQGARMALVTTKGFGDLLEIGNQARPDIFDLSCKTPSLLYEEVVEVKERVILEEFCCSELLERSPMKDMTRKVGVTKEHILVEEVPDLIAVKTELERLRDAGITSLAIAFMHAYTFHDHEVMVGNLARDMGCFEHISMSHQVTPMIKLVPRGHTTCAAAYLTPKITTYLSNFMRGFDERLSDVPLQFMKSDGGLAPVNDFGGHQAILSGPAGEFL